MIGGFVRRTDVLTSPAQKALWYIESHLSAPLSLDDIAAMAGVSRFHIVRAFAAETGV